jgi:predicted CopG family antitoxin
MAKTITITEESYNLLKSVKRRDESFSDVIKRLVAKEGRIMDSFGRCSIDEEVMKDLRKAWKKYTEAMP